MANAEEILFRLGIDGSRIEEGFKKAREKVNESAKEMAKDLAAPFAAFASFEGVKKVLEFGESIERGAEIAGVSTGFFQTFGAAMRQTGSSSEVANKGMEKLTVLLGEAEAGAQLYGIELKRTNGVSRDTEEVMREIADKIHNAASAQEKAAIAAAFFGKKIGEELIPALAEGSAGIDAFGKSISQLSEDDLKTLSQLNRDLESMGTTAEVWAGKMIGAVGGVSSALSAFVVGVQKLDLKTILSAMGGNPLDMLKLLKSGMSGVDDYAGQLGHDEAKKDEAKRNAPGVEAGKKDKTAHDDAAKERQKTHDKEITTEQHVTELIARREALEKKIGELRDAGANFGKEDLDLAKTENELQEAREKSRKETIQKEHDDAEKKKHDQDEINQKKREELRIHKELHSLNREIDRVNDYGKHYFGIDDLANSGLRGGQGGRNVDEARRIQFLENDEKIARAKGNTNFADRESQEQLRLTKDLENRGVIQKETTLEDLLDGIDDLTTALTDKGVKLQDTDD